MPDNSQKRLKAWQNPKKLKTMQVKLNGEEVEINFAFLYTFENHFDILLIQKSWIGADLDRQLPMKHDIYQTERLAKIR